MLAVARNAEAEARPAWKLRGGRALVLLQTKRPKLAAPVALLSVDHHTVAGFSVWCDLQAHHALGRRSDLIELEFFGIQIEARDAEQPPVYNGIVGVK